MYTVYCRPSLRLSRFFPPHGSGAEDLLAATDVTGDFYGKSGLQWGTNQPWLVYEWKKAIDLG